MKNRPHALTWNRDGRLAIATLTMPFSQMVRDLARVDELFDELDAYEKDPRVDALLFLTNDDEVAPPSTIRDIVEETQHEARTAPEQGRRSLLRSFNVLSRFAVRVAEYQKLVAVTWRGLIDPMNLAIGLAAGLRIAAEDVELHVTNRDVGLPPLGGLSYLLPTYLGLARAHSLLLRGKPLDAGRALDLGLVDAVLPVESFGESTCHEVQRLVQAHVENLHQNFPVVRVDAKVLHDLLLAEMHRLELLCKELLTGK